MQTDKLKRLFKDELSDMYSAEKQIVDALPNLIQTASNQELRKIFKDHLDETKNHVDRLDQVFKEINESPSASKCIAMENIIREGEQMTDKFSDPDVLDAAIISAAQRIEHYEMAVYGTLRNYASLLNIDRAVGLLQSTLDEEKEADSKLTELAEHSINIDAVK